MYRAHHPILNRWILREMLQNRKRSQRTRQAVRTIDQMSWQTNFLLPKKQQKAKIIIPSYLLNNKNYFFLIFRYLRCLYQGFIPVFQKGRTEDAALTIS